MECTLGYKIEGSIKITDPATGEVLVDKPNAINYETMSMSIAETLSSRGYGEIYQMAFGNGGASISATGVITYLPPNVTGLNAALYNQTYSKIVDDTSVFNTDPTRNKMTVLHTTGKTTAKKTVAAKVSNSKPVKKSKSVTSKYQKPKQSMVVPPKKKTGGSPADTPESRKLAAANAAAAAQGDNSNNTNTHTTHPRKEAALILILRH